MAARAAVSLLLAHTCPVTEFAVASHLNTANMTVRIGLFL